MRGFVLCWNRAFSSAVPPGIKLSLEFCSFPAAPPLLLEFSCTVLEGGSPSAANGVEGFISSVLDISGAFVSSVLVN